MEPNEIQEAIERERLQASLDGRAHLAALLDHHVKSGVGICCASKLATLMVLEALRKDRAI